MEACSSSCALGSYLVELPYLLSGSTVLCYVFSIFASVTKFRRTRTASFRSSLQQEHD